MAANTNSRLRVPTMPEGTEVGSYRTYQEASDAVDYLSDNGFDVTTITIVGTDLHMVERVTGRLTMGKVAASGAGSGALWGAFMGLMLSFAASSPGGAGLWLLIGTAGGVLFGALMSMLFYASTGGNRDFTSQSQVVASRYAVLAAAQIDEAFQLLQKTPGNQMRPVPRRTRVARPGPTEFGSRPDEQPRFGVRLPAGPEPGEGRASGAPDEGGASGPGAAGGPAGPAGQD
ncbi:general stress protein [Schaalia naturae]|uniref:General stress protein n=2 Tax=Schaalia naturae TaxID=635203 RepID=A0ABW2SN36_9ACTO